MKVKVTQGATTQVVSVGIQGPAGPTGITNVSEAADVDASELINGSILVYKTNTNRWTSTINLDAQNMEGGEF